MQKIKDFLKNKSIGYYVVAGVVLLSLIFAIIFLATYNNPAIPSVNNAHPMGNKAEGFVPETIAIFLIAAMLVEAVLLIVPQYRFLQIIAVLLFGLSFYKDLLIIADFFAGMSSGVLYNGGNLGLNLFYFFTLLIIVIAAVVAAFLGFLKSEEDVRKGIIPKSIPQLVTTSVGGFVVVAALVVSLTVSGNLTAQGGGKGNANNQQNMNSSVEPAKPKYDPITDEMKAAAEANTYSFDPTSVVFQEEETWNFSDARLSGLSYSATRSGHDLVYLFEGEYSEGYQGQYNTYLSGFYLWDDGVFAAKANDTTFKGFWYNSSLNAGVDENGDPKIDCLNMVSNTSNYESIIAEVPLGGGDGFYERQAYIYLDLGWGKRSVVVSGYKYYPDVAAFIDTNDNAEMKVGEKFVVNNTWFFDKVIKNLKYTQIIPTSEITWTLPDGMIDSSKRLLAAGEYQITAKWKSYEATATLKVS